MRAAIHTQYGPPDVVQVKDIDIPTPAANEVLIKVYASTVNRTDCGFRSAAYFISRFFSGLFKPKYTTLGCEFAGQIEAIGNGVTSFVVGDRVFGFDDARFGGHAAYKTIDEHKAVTKIPDGVSYAQAAPITEGAHYALCDIRAMKVLPGQKVLVNGASGAIGSAAVQLLKHFGAIVTAVCNTKNVPLLKSLGADTVIDYTMQDFTTTTEKFDIIFDAVGKSSFGKCKPLLTPNGIYKSSELGKNAENIWLPITTSFTAGKKVIFPIPTSSKEDVAFLGELVATGKFKPVVDRSYPLEQIVDAYKYVETGQKTGNVLLTIAH